VADGTQAAPDDPVPATPPVAVLSPAVLDASDLLA